MGARLSIFTAWQARLINVVGPHMQELHHGATPASPHLPHKYVVTVIVVGAARRRSMLEEGAMRFRERVVVNGNVPSSRGPRGQGGGERES